MAKYYIIGEQYDENGEDEYDYKEILYKTDSLEHAESFVQSFREGLRGFYVERDGQTLNAFQVYVKRAEEVPFDLINWPSELGDS